MSSKQRKPRPDGPPRGRGGFDRHGGPPREHGFQDSGYSRGRGGYGSAVGRGNDNGSRQQQGPSTAPDQAAPRGFDGKAVEKYFNDKYDEVMQQKNAGMGASIKVLEEAVSAGWGGAATYFPVNKAHTDFLVELRSQLPTASTQEPVAASAEGN